MNRKVSPWVSRIFISAFVVLTFFCWCPVLYGAYGAPDRIWGVPGWAVAAAGFAVALLVVEWVYLFATGATMSDDDLGEIVSQLEKVDTDNPDTSEKED